MFTFFKIDEIIIKFILTKYRSEGSLHQHLKLKHPEYVIEFGDKLIDSRHSET